jgi:putative hydrolase of the HAD superfamily
VAKLKTLIFDLGGVIVPFDFMRAYRRFEAMTGTPPETLRATIAATGLVPLFESGQVEPDEFVERLTAAIGVSMSRQEFRDLWVSIFLPEALIPEEFLERLRHRHRLLLLSNTNAIHFDMVRETYPQLRHFDRWVLSHEVKAMKPSAAIYAAALAHARAEPGECFFTDDVPAYVEGARNAGIDAEQFTGLDALVGHLRARGVET